MRKMHGMLLSRTKTQLSKECVPCANNFGKGKNCVCKGRKARHQNLIVVLSG